MFDAERLLLKGKLSTFITLIYYAIGYNYCNLVPLKVKQH